MTTTSHLWAVVLAGGDGLRMAPLTRDTRGAHVPKQFCRFAGEGSLLRQALDRAASLVDPRHVIIVVQEAHRRWWEPELTSFPPDNVLSQAVNRGTAVAVLHAVSRALELDRDPYLIILPSDHAVDDEPAWQLTLNRACRAAIESPEALILVGVEAQSDPHFGWLLPGERAVDGTHTVLEFVEKPGPVRATRLALQGALCSTFVFASSGRALLRLFASHAAGLVRHYSEALRWAGQHSERRPEAHEGLPACDFSRDILEHAPEDVRVLPSPCCGWTDLGTPWRLERWLQRRRASRRHPIVDRPDVLLPAAL